MTAATSTAGALGTLLRVSVTAGERTVDLGAPGNVPVAELVPGLARTLGLLDAATVHGGFRLVRTDGRPVDSDRSLQAQGVEDGSVLTLEPGAHVADVRVYDDVVEAVADAVEGQYAPWTARDSALTAVVAATAFLLTGAALLLGADQASLFPPVVAAAGALLVLGAAAVVGRVGGHDVGARALVLTASVFGLVAGLTAGTGAPSWGMPATLGGVGMLVVAVIGIPTLPSGREICVAPGVLGLTLGVVGAVVAGTGAAPGAVLAVVVAVAVTAGNAIPWLALASTPLRVISPRSDAEILLDPVAIDPDEVREQYGRGHRLQVALRVAVGALAIAAAPAVVATGVAGTLLLTAAFVGMLLGVRQTYSRHDVLVVMGAGILGLTVTGVLAAAAHPEWRSALAMGAGGAAALVIALSLVAPRQRVAMGRAADTLELLCLALLLPLGIAAAGLV
ncbi:MULTISPECIES: type VII secretion integral membrane protein EccD [unclassified Actinotalea]|uniref:type VII secretion integral membrane protein EccD n=1 Tax=unclassified Actinotalea TaxID=2638618 RepID=UPI0015F36329|nr:MULTISPECIES: type VII secretion integral membrane protein EccD [unclassified Actinotalea]